MSVFRVEKNKGYTVMSNHHLRNHALSLKAKGLLSQMLSLPEDWDYTLQGLAQINKESIDAIREAVRELERAGYINRSRGCYVMDITGHVQSMWNYYQEAVEELGENAPWEEIAERIKTRTMYMGPEAYGLYTQNYSVMQGMTPSDGSLTKEDAPIKIDIAYTLVK